MITAAVIASAAKQPILPRVQSLGLLRYARNDGRVLLVLSSATLAACSPTSSSSPDGGRYQFVSGSKDRVSFLFDRDTGCIAEVVWVPDWAKEPQFDHTKPFTVDDAPVETPTEDVGLNGGAKSPKSNLAPKSSEKVAAVSSFEPWQCPKPAPTLAKGTTK